jgi:hypothetical protein
MAEPATQNYATHARKTPLIYRAALIVLVANVAAYAYYAVRAFSFDALLGLRVAFALVVVAAYARGQTLTVQNRVIRLEERLRYQRLLPAEVAESASALPVPQIVALRFASDAELPTLVDEVLSGQLTDPKAIKMRIKNWRGDHLRA